MDYIVSNIAQLDDAIDDGADFADYIYLPDGTDLTGASAPRALDCRVIDGAHVTIGSSLPVWLVFENDCSLTVPWEGETQLTFRRRNKHANVVVHLTGWPEGSRSLDTVSKSLERQGITVQAETDCAPALPPERVSASDIQVLGPPHYVWLGESLVANGAPESTKDLQSWDLLDAMFPDSPHLWNAGKYLTRFGRKGDASKHVEDLHKAITYLERAIKAEERNAG